MSVRLEIRLSASATSDSLESGDWLIRGGVLRCDAGVENAPVDCRCRASKSSCSSFGSRGGEGPVRKGSSAGGEGWGLDGVGRKWWRGVVERRRFRVKRDRFGDLGLGVHRNERRGVSIGDMSACLRMVCSAGRRWWLK